MSNQHLDASTLPPFNPTKDVVQCANRPMSALMWAFSSCVPPLARIALSMPGGASNASLKTNTTPQMQWNYSMFHLAHHYEEEELPRRKFMVTDDAKTASILIEVTALRSCPKDVEGALSEFAYFDPANKETHLGAPPLFFVRYLYEERGKKQLTERDIQLYEDFFSEAQSTGGIIAIYAASVEEVYFAHKELQRGQALVGKTAKTGQFNESVLFPTPIDKTKSAGKAPYVCASCDAIITQRPAPSCSRCKVTFYCNRECQLTHWKSGGHKKVCSKGGGNKTGGEARKSFIFDIEDAKPPVPPDGALASINYKTGNMNVSGVNKEQRADIKKKGRTKVLNCRTRKKKGRWSTMTRGRIVVTGMPGTQKTRKTMTRRRRVGTI